MKPTITLLAAGAMLGAASLAQGEGSVKVTPGDEMQEKRSLPGHSATPEYSPGDEMKEHGTSGMSTQSDDTTRARNKDDVVRDLKGLHDGDDVTRSR